MSEEEDKRARQLEEARRRVEELKKKKNKKNKKKKEPEELTEEQKLNGESAVAENVSGGESQSESVTPEGTDEVAVKPDSTPNFDSTEADKEINDEKPLESHAEEDINSQAEKIEPKVDETVELAVPEPESTFLEHISKANELDGLQKQIDDLNEENKKLKFDKMELETTIESLEDDLKQVKIELEKSKKTIEELQTQTAKTPNSPHIQLSNFNEQHQSPKKASFVPPANQFLINDPIIDIKTLEKWRHWNVDMTSWRSIGSGPIVDL